MTASPRLSPTFRRIVTAYTIGGVLLGIVLTIGAWLFQLQIDRMMPTVENFRIIHERNKLLWLTDFLPIVAGVIAHFIGRIQAKLEDSRQGLEARVNERTFEIAMEKARTQAILDTAADAILTFDREGKIRGFNNAAERIFGYRQTEAIGRDLNTIIPALDWEEQRTYTELVKEKGVLTPAPESREFEGLRRDGTNVPIEVDISKFNIGEENSYTAIVRDISERKRQERLQESLMAVTEAVNRAEDLGSLYESIHNTLGDVIETTNFTVALYHAKDDQFEIAYQVDEHEHTRGKIFPAAGSTYGLVLKRQRALLMDKARLMRLVEQGKIEDGEHGFVSWLGVPLINLGKPIGVIVVRSYVEGVNFTDRDVWIMNFVSAEIANAIERERARDSLRTSEKRYRRMVEEAGEIVYTTDLHGNFTYVNPPTERLTGYTSEELIGRHFSFLIDDHMVGRVNDFYTRQFKKGTRETVLEFPMISKKGKKLWVEQKTTLVSENGRVLGFESVLHDVTARREAEEALREREERFRSLSASSPTGIFQLDEKGHCIYVNRRFEEITGRPSERILGALWTDVIHPDERDTFRTEWIFARDDPSSSAARELRVMRPNGEVGWVNLRWTATNDDAHQITGYVGTFEDITARKEQERIQQALYDISRAVQDSSDLKEFYGKLHRLLSSVIDTTNFYIATYEEESQFIQFPYAYENWQQNMELPGRALGKGLTGYLIRRAIPILLDKGEMEKLYDRGEAILLGKPAESWLGVPLMSEGHVIGAVIVQSYDPKSIYTEADVKTMSFVSSQIASAIKRKQAEQNAQTYYKQLSDAHQRIKEDLAVAARIQRSRLPKTPPAVQGVEFSWLFDSCDEVAGDMFNFVQLDKNRIGIYILDVSGHGIPAALLSMSLSRALTASPDGSGVLLRDGGHDMRIAEPREVVEAMNERYPMNLETNQYFTLIYGILDLTRSEFRYVRAGHPSPIYMNGEVAQEIDVECGPAVGIIPGVEYREKTIKMNPGDRIYLFTDGLDEATNPAGEEFGMERILECLNDEPALSMHESIDHLRRCSREFIQGRSQSDDITIVGFGLKRAAVEIEGSAEAKVPQVQV